MLVQDVKFTVMTSPREKAVQKRHLCRHVPESHRFFLPHNWRAREIEHVAQTVKFHKFWDNKPIKIIIRVIKTFMITFCWYHWNACFRNLVGLFTHWIKHLADTRTFVRLFLRIIFWLQITWHNMFNNFLNIYSRSMGPRELKQTNSKCFSSCVYLFDNFKLYGLLLYMN